MFLLPAVQIRYICNSIVIIVNIIIYIYIYICIYKAYALMHEHTSMYTRGGTMRLYLHCFIYIRFTSDCKKYMAEVLHCPAGQLPVGQSIGIILPSRSLYISRTNVKDPAVMAYLSQHKLQAIV